VYYDRHIDDALADTLRGGGPLAWLMDHVESPDGKRHHAHLQFRCARGDRGRGSIQLYWGRTSPLEFQSRRGDRVRLQAHSTYRDGSPDLFSQAIPLTELGALEPQLRAHLRRASAVLLGPDARRQAFLKGEATCHAGLMRRYGHTWLTGDPLLALDAEVRVGFDSRDAQRRDDEALARQLALKDGEALPKKLDAVGVSPEGDLVLVEVKDAKGDISRAVTQAAAHVARFNRLLEGGLATRAQRMLEQKRRVGLVPPGCPDVSATPRVIPWVAAPDADPNWARRWTRDTQALRTRLTPLLMNLRWVRLTEHGDVLEVTLP
jgi:hypothetical protein